ncbi:MAG: winged helix-turn-helix domain-containing protein [Gammaproteobacteria bacterium]|nr:winged helix-turn-helix domain-containing protein [Gammaproteobacteria bacterium]
MLKPKKSLSDNHLRILDIDIDISSGTVWRAGEVVDLPDLSFRLLRTLATRAPAMVSKDDLIAEVWGDVIVSDETLMQRVRLLRQALGEDSQNPRYIAAVRGRGYRLTAPVEAGTMGTPSAPRPHSRRWRLGMAVAIAVLVVLGLSIGLRGGPEGPTISTLAVLPFNDMSEDRSFGFFADGMQEELLSRLARLDEIAVLSRTSAEQYRNTTESIPNISRALNANGIIEGSVRVNGDKVRITVQLIEGATDRHIWAETYEEELTVENIFAIQNDVANRIANALRVEYRRQKSGSLVLPTANLDAYNLYLLGRYHTFRQTPESLDLAVQYLEQAIERDADFAEAHAALGWAYTFLGTEYGGREPVTVIPRAREAAVRALELDDQLADAHSLYADILTWYDWEFELAESEYRRTMLLDSLNVLGYALFLSTQGRHDEAIILVERRLEAAPDDDYVQVNAGWRYLHAGRPDDAIRVAARATSHPDAASLLGFSKLAQGELAEAIAVFEDDLRRQGRGPMQLGNLAYAHFRAGNESTAQYLLDELETESDDSYVSPVLLAAVHFAAGNEARGYELLNAAVDARARGVIFLNVSTAFVDRRGDPIFTAVLERVGLPAERP